MAGFQLMFHKKQTYEFNHICHSYFTWTENLNITAFRFQLKNVSEAEG